MTTIISYLRGLIHYPKILYEYFLDLGSSSAAEFVQVYSLLQNHCQTTYNNEYQYLRKSV